MKTKLEDLRIVNNFYQTSAFFPMPIVLCGTLAENGQTNLGTYSLVFPYYIAEKEYFAFILMSRNSSNTVKNIMRTGKVTLNFVSDKKKYVKESIRLGFPGVTTEEKMKDCIFTLTEGLMSEENPKEQFPKVVEESFQSFECSWVKELDNKYNKEVKKRYTKPFNDFNGITSKHGSHFILRIDKVLMKAKYKKQIIEGIDAWDFPKVPVDYGYRDNKNFWISKYKEPYKEKIQSKSVKVETVVYAADRIDPAIKFTKEACATLVKVPRIFLNTALKGCVKWAKENKVTLVTKEHMEIIRNKRNNEKKK